MTKTKLRPLHNRSDFQRAVQEHKSIPDDSDQDSLDYRHVLGLLIADYQRRNCTRGNSIGSTLKELAASRGWTQPQLAAKCGVTKSHICNIMSEKTLPSVNLIARFAREFNVDPSIFF